jgi:WD40 repeat protein
MRGYPLPMFSPPKGVPSSADAFVASKFAISDFYATVSLDGTIQLFKLPDGPCDRKEDLVLIMTSNGGKINDGQDNAVTDIVFSPDGRFLSWGREDGSVSLYDIQATALVIVVAPPCG